MLRKSQATANVVLSIPLIKKDGSQAIGLALNTLSTKIIAPDGTALAGYTEATLTEPNGDGVYVCIFPSNAATKAFTLVDQANPYVVALDSSTADVEPTTREVEIVSAYPWETAKGTDLATVAGYIDTEIQSIITSLTTLLGSGNTAVDHNTGPAGTVVADAMRVMYDGLPVDGAVIEVYQCTLANYNLGVRGVVKARSESKADGRWLRPVYVDGGLTYTVVIYKQGAFQPLAIEVILP